MIDTRLVLIRLDVVRLGRISLYWMECVDVTEHDMLH